MATRRSDRDNSTNPRLAWLWSVCAALVVACVLQLGIQGHPYHNDERLWLKNAGKFYPKAFTERDMGNPIWWRWGGLDQPHLGRFLYGAVITATGQGDQLPHLATMKRYRARLGYEKNVERGAAPPAAVLVPCRRTSAAMAAMACLMLLFIGASAFNWRVGLIACLWLGLSPLTWLVCRRAMTDGPLLLALLAGMLFVVLMLKAALRDQLARSLWWSLPAGLAVGVATSVKFNGAMAGLHAAGGCLLVAAATVWVIVRARGGHTRTGTKPYGRRIVTVLAAGLIIGISSFALFVAVNPTLYPGPIENIGKILKQREETRAIIVTDKTRRRKILENVAQRATFIRDTLFIPDARRGFGLLAQSTGWPLDIALVLAGLAVVTWAEVRHICRTGTITARSIVLLWVLITFGLMSVWLPIARFRYCLPMQAIVALLCAAAIDPAMCRLVDAGRARIARAREANAEFAQAQMLEGRAKDNSA